MAALPVEAKVRLLTGADSWRTYGDDTLGLRPIVMSDGPAGVRGVTKDDRNPSASLPCPSALGATWDSELVRELAAALGAEARGKGIDVVLAPTINLMRTPLGGRGFECFSEDPVLAARIAAGYVAGLQSAGVGAAVKHYVGNDSETGRWTYDARIAEAVLHELYLVPFEASVREAGALMVMAAYNSVNGALMTEHEGLLRGVLKDEWGFTGVIVSDWSATRSTVPTAQAGLDLAMPGPTGALGSGPGRRGPQRRGRRGGDRRQGAAAAPAHIWSTVSDPATYADAKPVGTGPFMLDKFSPQGYTLKQNPFYWNKSKVHVPEIDFPAYNTNANLVPPVSSGQIDFAGNYVANIKSNFLAKSPENHTWLNSQPYFSANNVVSMYLNTTKAPLSDPAVRQAISYGINRNQLNVQGETGYEPPVNSTSGLLLPNHQSYLDPVAGQQPPGHR